MRILAVGDVCGPEGLKALKDKLSKLKKENKIDVVIVNGENSAETNGITKESAEFIFSCGADIITGGNHSFRRKEVYEYLDENEFVLRPHNMKDGSEGRGYAIYDFGRFRIAVINLLGRVYLERNIADNPFETVDFILNEIKNEGVNIIIVDFHAEATSEKRAMGFYLDGLVSAVFGTHTHVQTADEQILPLGTGYITDVGMTGVKDSILGVKKEIIVNRLRHNDMSKFEFAEGDTELCACIFEIDNISGKTIKVERINI